MVVAAFDFDGTLSTRDNLAPFLRRLVGTRRLAAALARISPSCSQERSRTAAATRPRSR